MGLLKSIVKPFVDLGKAVVKVAGAIVNVAVQGVSILTSAIIGKPKIPEMGNQGIDDPSSLGNRLQVAPATNNKLPVIYGKAYTGGIVTDLTITSNNQTLYYVISLCEVTNTETGSSPDNITFGKIYYGGKLCTFDSVDQTKVISLTDESTGAVDVSVSGNIYIYLYKNGSSSPVNTTQTAIQILSASDLIYKWDPTKLMSNCAFAIVKLNYNANAGITGIQQTRFEITNSRSDTGACFLDYLNSSRYGAAIPLSQIDTTSLAELSTYSNELMTYTTYQGTLSTLQRFRFDGLLETSRSIQANMQVMSDCCDCLIRYNEITAKWGVIVQKPTYTAVMDINDSNIISAITITPVETASTYNIAEVYFPDKTAQDSFNSATFDLAEIDPSLLYINEPVNKQNISLPLVNDSVRAQYLANRFLKACREDLQVTCTVMFVGLQLEAGDIVTITNAKYGWTAKPFRVRQVRESFNTDGTIAVDLSLMEFNASVYDDANITEFTPAPNTGIGSPTVFGTLQAPTVSSQYPNNTNPLFLLNVTTSSAGIIQYAEVWYSAFSNPTTEQLMFAGTSEIQSNGTPWNPNTTLPPISLASIPAGNWYFFSRMVNSLATSQFSPASSMFSWRPSTFQYTEKYLSVAYADNITGTSNFSLSPTNRLYYGLYNTSSSTPSTNPADYTWYLAEPDFDANKFVCYSNRTGRKFSFATGFADYAAGTGAFVPTQAIIFDPRIWSALPDGTNIIDLDAGTGQVLQTGTTTVGTGEIAVTNSPDGKVVASLKQYLDFGSGVYSQTATGISSLTIDIYGRVVGFTVPDSFYFTANYFNATAGQTVFSVTRSTGYISGQCLVFKNGALLDTSEYTDTGGSTGTVTLATAAVLNDQIAIMSFKSVAFSGGAVYASFSRSTADLVNASAYTPPAINSGYELLFLNGIVLSDLDYDIVGGTITNLPSLATGKLTIISWTPNNLTTPNGDPVNVLINSIIGQTAYNFSYTTGALNLYMNGVLLTQGIDYTTATGGYVLANTPTTIIETQLQQTFARTGAA